MLGNNSSIRTIMAILDKYRQTQTVVAAGVTKPRMQAVWWIESGYNELSLFDTTSRTTLPNTLFTRLYKIRVNEESQMFDRRPHSSQNKNIDNEAL